MPLMLTVVRVQVPGPPDPLLRVTVTRKGCSPSTCAVHVPPLPVTRAPVDEAGSIAQPADIVHDTRMLISWPMSYPTICSLLVDGVGEEPESEAGHAIVPIGRPCTCAMTARRSRLDRSVDKRCRL
jgi:hypothetical protein